MASDYQADYDALLANGTSQLQHLLQLSLNYCEKFQVKLSSVKTKLLAFCNNSDDVKYDKLISPIHMGDMTIPFVDSAEHVGVLRSVMAISHIFTREW